MELGNKLLTPCDTGTFKATTGVREAHLSYACKPCFIAAMPLQTYGNK